MLVSAMFLAVAFPIFAAPSGEGGMIFVVPKATLRIAGGLSRFCEWSSDGAEIAIQIFSGGLHISPNVTGSPRTLAVDGFQPCIAFRKGTRELFCADRFDVGPSRIYRVSNGRMIRAAECLFGVTALGFLDRETMLIGTREKVIALSTKSWRPAVSTYSSQGGVRVFVASASGRYLLAAGDSRVTVRDATGTKTYVQGAGFALSGCYRRDEREVVTSCGTKVTVWPLPDGEPRHLEHSAEIEGAFFVNDSLFMVDRRNWLYVYSWRKQRWVKINQFLRPSILLNAGPQGLIAFRFKNCASTFIHQVIPMDSQKPR